jgi:phage-related protein
MEPAKKLLARFYRNTQGNELVREWLKSLTPTERQVIGKDMQKVEFGWPLGLPVCRPLGDGLWEVRSDLPSRRTARVIFCIVAGQMILLHGFIKKTPQTPRRDLNIARVRKAETTQAREETQP